MFYQHAKISKISEENPRVKTFILDCDLKTEPGQFLMLWIPESGERPMSIAGANPLTLSIANVGKVSASIHSKKVGDRIFFRGPLGKPFTFQSSYKRIVLVGGGYGVAPLRFLASAAAKKKISVKLIMGAKTKGELMASPDKKICETIITTDDGSEGQKGFTTDALTNLLADNSSTPDAVYACGPELMMKKVAEICKQNKIPCQVSLERIMKCGIGLCGSCSVDGKLCCCEGPVFTGDEALGVKEFGSPQKK
ncbi:Sulfide dehydrogenase subunit beta [Candidatus Gugararchaeum adminiculabundum]|nr:Sulfide dehydrogenase subunit beta [Candidatus Gugararchaeum adminiculabundum]